MTNYAPGTRIIVRDEEWTIKKVERNKLGNEALYCYGVSPLVRNRDAIFLTDLESIAVVDPSETRLAVDASPMFARSLLYIESLWRRQIPTELALVAGSNAAMDYLPYQLEPAQIALNSPRQRILIADAVGLGKTLEAGVALSELIARGKGRRILVVTTKSMTAQFQKEMWTRFTIPLVRLDSKRIRDIRAQLPSNYNPFSYYDKTIVSIDTLKRDLEYRVHLENSYWDVIVIDEAHNVAERGGREAQRARLAKLLADRSDAMIMLSATPHDGRAKSFASLMNMLDPTAIADPTNYTKDEIRGLCVRRFKKDVKYQTSGAFLERRVELERSRASVEEERAFDVFTGMELRMDAQRTSADGVGMLFKTSLEKALFSSPAACVKSIDERVKKLEARKADKVKRGETDENAEQDLKVLSEFRDALTEITPQVFSRYQLLLQLLRNAEYGWNPSAKNDRVVVFTERIETMKFLAENLRKDLKMSEEQVCTISGEDKDVDQQKIVDDFGRDESPVRILVASDVASEGLNLHYLCHRLIHFDVPWSLMVFQQRNGRVDRYGQTQQPDIRYMLVESENKRIHGDMRIFEILVRKEQEALKNIGDPALLMGKFNIVDEELVVAETLENGADSDAFSDSLDTRQKELDPFESMFADATAESTSAAPCEIKERKTLFSESAYIRRAADYLNGDDAPKEMKDDAFTAEPLMAISGVELSVNASMRARFDAILPDEAKPSGGKLKLTDDKNHIMKEIRRSLRKAAEDAAWPTIHYLWALHPIFDWLNEKCALLFNRGEAPILALPNSLAPDETIFLFSAVIPNLRSTPLVDEWFGLEYRSGVFQEKLDMNEVVQRAKLREKQANPNKIPTGLVPRAQALVPDAVERARAFMSERYREFNAVLSDQRDEELGKLAELEKRHKAYQRELFDKDPKKKEEHERMVDQLFEKFVDWAKETHTIQDAPQIKVVAVLTGVEL